MKYLVNKIYVILCYDIKNDYRIYHIYSDKKTFIDIKLYKGFIIFICDISNENNTQQHSSKRFPFSLLLYNGPPKRVTDNQNGDSMK